MENRITWQALWIITKYENQQARDEERPFAVIHIPHNVGCNAGIDELWDLVCGTGSPTSFAEANAYVGVGDRSYPTPLAADTALAAPSYGLNKFFMPMDTGYPQTTSQKATWRGEFAAGKATMSWFEFCVCNTSWDNGVMLNRTVSSQAYKQADQVWTLTCELTMS